MITKSFYSVPFWSEMSECFSFCSFKSPSLSNINNSFRPTRFLQCNMQGILHGRTMKDYSNLEHFSAIILRCWWSLCSITSSCCNHFWRLIWGLPNEGKTLQSIHLKILYSYPIIWWRKFYGIKKTFYDFEENSNTIFNLRSMFYLFQIFLDKLFQCLHLSLNLLSDCMKLDDGSASISTQ